MMPGMMPGGRPTRPGQTQEAEGSQIDKERDRMFDAVSFRLEFRAYEDFFWNVLNGLLADDNQVVITSLAVTNSNELLWPEYLKPVGSSQPARRSRAAPRPARRRQNELADLFGMGGEPGELSATLEPQDEVTLAGLEERRQYLVGGDLLRVVMEVKVYRLKPEETETTPEGR